MRIQHIKIRNWRHVESVDLAPPPESSIVCLVGANGTGKSQILEIIAEASQRIGLTRGYGAQRAQPFGEASELEVKFHIGRGTVATLDEPAPNSDLASVLADWDRTLTVSRTPTTHPVISAGGISSERAADYTQQIIRAIGQSESIHYLMLDADRAYPEINVDVHQIGTAVGTDWDSENKQRTFYSTRNLYDEWFRYLIGTEGRENNKHIAAIRLARERGEPEPVFVDKMDSYKKSIKQVLPHLLFTGINNLTRQVQFDSTGMELSFNHLSGGEREIAFLVGQIERFALRKGLLLLDEPELHLNYDLLRAWIAFLKGTIDEGQVWFATHSLEVIEITGAPSTFLIERDENSRKITSASSLNNRPVLTTLSRAVGSPAFSISNQSFVLIEGVEDIGERERFRQLCGQPSKVRFMVGGNCGELERRHTSLLAIAAASGEPLRVGGVTDSDWRGPAERERLRLLGVYMLEVHEVENFFLHPGTVEHIMAAIGKDPAQYKTSLVAECDRRGGIWIFNAARSQRAFKDYPAPSEKARGLAHDLPWDKCGDLEATAHSLVAQHGGLSSSQNAPLARYIAVYGKIYSRHRESGTLWKTCEGKEIFRSLASKIGFSDPRTAEAAMMKTWADKPELIPAELASLHAYVMTI